MRLFLCVLAVAILSGMGLAQSTPLLHHVEISISNPGDQPRYAENIVVPFAHLRKEAPDINAGSLFVTTPGDDPKAHFWEQSELPSQVDDLDGDGEADELAFQIDLK